MPSKSKAQHNLMAMVAHDPKAAKRVGIPQSVGRDYVKADKGRKFGGAGMKYARGGGIESRGKTKGTMVKMAGGGSVGSASKRADGVATKGKTKGKLVAMRMGGKCY
jgi:hypothetical protein